MSVKKLAESAGDRAEPMLNGGTTVAAQAAALPTIAAPDLPRELPRVGTPQPASGGLADLQVEVRQVGGFLVPDRVIEQEELKVVSVRMPHSMHFLLKMRAAQLGISLQDLVLRSLTDSLHGLDERFAR